KGFKSFAQSTTFAFETGVTCVVGPNGSGKSNVVDALAWVMGEQGAKTLRGGKMEDVIFAGTATKGPLGRAEVILTIDNADGALPIDYAEVTISRTLFRNGGSDYAINGRSCRLLDVQELLSDSGLGREMHVIVGQGQLDAVLHASPEDRRGFIEEAAGILKHRRRKEKTLRKLDAMQVNLTRLSDLAGEVRRQLKPLGHQAEIAREARTIASVVRDARARLLADDVVTVRAALTINGRGESERKTERVVLQEQLDQARLRGARLLEAQDSDLVDQARRTAFGLESVQERLRGLFSLANQRFALIGQQSDSASPFSGVTEQTVLDAQQETERLRAADSRTTVAGAAARTQTLAARARLAALDEQIAEQSAAISRHDLEISRLTGQFEAAASRLAALRGEALRQENASAAALARRIAAEAQLSIVETDAESLGGIGDTDTDYDVHYATAQSEVSHAETEIDRLRDAVHTLERERDSLAARTKALSQALDQKDGSSALVAATLPGIRGLLAEHLQITPGYEAAIAAALGSLTDAVLADDRDTAVAALAHSASAQLGRLELLVAELGHNAVPAVPRTDAAISAPSVVTAPGGVLALLASVVIVDTTDAAHVLWASLSDSEQKSLTVVTLSGDLLSRLVLRGGSGARRSRLELVADRDAAADRLTETGSLIERARFALGERQKALHTAKVNATRALAALRAYDARFAEQAQALSHARGVLEAAVADADRLGRAAQLSTDAVAEVAATVERARDEREAMQQLELPTLDLAQRDALVAALEQCRESEVAARLTEETARERVRASVAHALSLQKQLEAERAQAEDAARRAVIRRRGLDAAHEVISALPAVLDAVDRSVSTARVDLKTREAERLAQSEEISELRREENLLRDRLQAVSEDVHGIEMLLYESRVQLAVLVERAASELGLDEEMLVAEYGPDQPVIAPLQDAPTSTPHDAPPGDLPGTQTTPFVRAEQEKRLAKAERSLAQLGRVNPLALEEFAALEQRHLFLADQLTDLTNTRRDLLTIIDEIDEKMQHIFAAAFEDTRVAFNSVFPVLFPGGTGSIHLTEPNNLLTTGIEVTVKPAGKKIERLSLLSGGERSLAAVALLIAIFKARPSPFYIMDEVEAALDDANLGRLLTIFEDLRESSQLIIITHQKRTMEIADALYGVSMRADGISAVVGQRVQRLAAES
ncbi:MAG: chromosome segregation protein SMC, partial [Microbacteriaceae bacterium]|nr:chromosome segregation protein SMC [Microbacteriaceae bacterium]